MRAVSMNDPLAGESYEKFVYKSRIRGIGRVRHLEGSESPYPRGLRRFDKEMGNPFNDRYREQGGMVMLLCAWQPIPPKGLGYRPKADDYGLVVWLQECHNEVHYGKNSRALMDRFRKEAQMRFEQGTPRPRLHQNLPYQFPRRRGTNGTTEVALGR